jgi:hypothetical protein
MVESSSRAVRLSGRTAESFGRTEKSFYRAKKSFRHGEKALKTQKMAKTAPFRLQRQLPDTWMLFPPERRCRGDG